MAERCVQEGMKVVLADMDSTSLAKTEKSMKASGATVLAVRTDVSQARDIESLAQETVDAFGAIHLLCNNAGVWTGASVWESTIADWEWVIGVNLWGVIHGVRVFVPIMLAQDTECHIVNTASIAGLLSGPGLGVYKVTKHGIVTLSETLHHELVERGESQGFGALSSGCQHAHHAGGAKPSWGPSEGAVTSSRLSTVGNAAQSSASWDARCRSCRSCLQRSQGRPFLYLHAPGR